MTGGPTALAEPYASALREAVDFILAELEPVGIVASGTIIRGTAHRNTDLDLYVVRLGTHRRRVQRFFRGVPAEIFAGGTAIASERFAHAELFDPLGMSTATIQCDAAGTPVGASDVYASPVTGNDSASCISTTGE